MTETILAAVPEVVLALQLGAAVLGLAIKINHAAHCRRCKRKCEE
jgi:hypothetical protein